MAIKTASSTKSLDGSESLRGRHFEVWGRSFSRSNLLVRKCSLLRKHIGNTAGDSIHWHDFLMNFENNFEERIHKSYNLRLQWNFAEECWRLSALWNRVRSLSCLQKVVFTWHLQKFNWVFLGHVKLNLGKFEFEKDIDDYGTQYTYTST